MSMLFSEEVNSFNAEAHSMHFLSACSAVDSICRTLPQFLLGERSDDAVLRTERLDALSGYGDPSYP